MKLQVDDELERGEIHSGIYQPIAQIVAQLGAARAVAAAANFMPAGKADFDGQLIDVIAEGLPIDRGQRVVGS